MRDRTELTYDSLGDYDMSVTVYQADGTILVKDTLAWEYSQEEAPDAIVDFNEVATNDANVILLVSAGRGAKTKELWIEGDLQFYPEGNWYDISDTNMVPILLTEDDGIKTIKVKHRNVYGAESDKLHTMKILKKSDEPENCMVTAIAEKTANGRIRMKFEGENSGSLYYNVFGDVGEVGGFTKFDESVKADIALSQDEGEKSIVAKIRDVAENYCESFPMVIEYDKTYKSEYIAIEDDVLWTDTQLVTLELNYDHFPAETAEMYIYGSVENFGDVRQWVPFSESSQVMLSASEGHRFVRAKFRDAEGVETLEQYVGIYLKPYIRFQTIAGVDYVLVSKIQTLTNLTITGCTQAYNDVPYEDKFPCTPAVPGAPLQVTYKLNDGTSVSKSVIP
jgi:hypothetical protein